eukprot:TRINITY_DN17986_c0_g3_i4.p1 TRINITY_DN17986_c0_g3~~TRINITY_DN17986_c0_g3_i4.p1  ORF type:complete len:117 (+),score=8.24 TRINITY_DN17986_c0_g3_i4:618-968(+)
MTLRLSPLITTLLIFLKRHNCNPASRAVSSACNGLVGFILPENPAMIDPFSVRLRMMDLLSACNLIDEGEKSFIPSTNSFSTTILIKLTHYCYVAYLMSLNATQHSHTKLRMDAHL